MRRIPGTRLGVLASLALLALGFSGAAANGSTSADCNDGGRAICISITDQDEVTHSTPTVNRYTSYTIVVSNGGGSTLTNGRVDVVLKDVVGGVESAATGAFIGVPSGCTPVSSTAFTCPLPNLGALAPAPALQVFARTSTNTAAEAMKLTATAAFKEKGRDSEGPASNPDTFSWSETTSLEPRPDFSQSIVFFGGTAFPGHGSTTLETAPLSAPGANGQTTRFRVPVLAALGGSELPLAFLEEFNPSATGYFCPVASCFGQSVKTKAPGGVFSSSNLANLLTTMDIALLPRGVTEKSLTVHHDDDSFSDKCSGGLGEAPDVSEVPCRRVEIDRKAGIVTIDVWDDHQGDWGFS